MTEYILIRSKRKTIGLYIRDGVLEVRAPLVMPKRDIDMLLVSKEKWLQDNLVKSKEWLQRRKEICLNYGDFILYLGQRYPIVSGEVRGFDGEAFYMPPSLSSEEIKATCIKCYRSLAKRHLANRVHEFSQKMSVMPSSIKITSAKTRWGSCSSKKSINFSWRLIMMESDVVDYVVVHELAHLIEMNHSKRFWEIVEAVLPDYKQRKKRLREVIF